MNKPEMKAIFFLEQKKTKYKSKASEKKKFDYKLTYYGTINKKKSWNRRVIGWISIMVILEQGQWIFCPMKNFGLCVLFLFQFWSLDFSKFQTKNKSKIYNCNSWCVYIRCICLFVVIITSYHMIMVIMAY